MANEIQLFKGAGLPSANLAKFKRNLAQVQAEMPQVGGLPILKLGKDGVWRYGQEDTEVQEGSEWAINPQTIAKGFIAWLPGSRQPREVMRLVFEGNLPRFEDLPDVGVDEKGESLWRPNYAFELTCLNGDDKDLLVKYAAGNKGAGDAFKAIVAQMLHQAEVKPTHMAMIVTLTNTGYQSSTLSWGIKGWIEKPVFELVEWGYTGPVGGEETEAEDDQQSETQQSEIEQPQRRAAAPARGAAPAREPAKEAAPARRGPGRPPAGAKREAAPARNDGNGSAAEATAAEQAAAAGQPEDAGPVVRRRRRAAVTDIPA